MENVARWEEHIKLTTVDSIVDPQRLELLHLSPDSLPIHHKIGVPARTDECQTREGG